MPGPLPTDDIEPVRCRPMRRELRAGVAVLASVGLSASIFAFSGSSPASAGDVSSITCDPVARTEPAPAVDLESYEPIVPVRIVDTRDGTGGADQPLDAGCTLRVDLDETTVPPEAEAVALSLTVIASVPTFFTAHPCAAGLPETSNLNAPSGVPVANQVVISPDSNGEVCIYSRDGGKVILDIAGWWLPGTDRFTPIEPARAFDSRVDLPIKLPGGAVQDIDVGGSIIPDDASAVSVNLAVVRPNDLGWMVIYGCGVDPPLASNLNFNAGENRAVSATVEVGVDGKICVTGSVDTDFLVDITGYYSPTPWGPQVDLDVKTDVRVADSRTASGPWTTRFRPGEVRRLDLGAVLERPDESTGVMLNVVAVGADDRGFLSVTPCVPGAPTTSSLNHLAGSNTANLVVTEVSSDGEVCFFTSTGVHLVVDLFGEFAGPLGSLATELSLGETEVHADFETGDADYAARCGDVPGTGPFTVGLAPGATATVNGTPTQQGEVTVDLSPDALISVELARGAERQVHHIRCLPPDFPDYTVTTTTRPAAGWYVTGFGVPRRLEPSYIAIFDERFVPVWYKRTDRALIDVKRLSTGDLVMAPLAGVGFGIDPNRGHRVHALDGSLDREEIPADSTNFPMDHHDYNELPGGGRGVVSYPLLGSQDLTPVNGAASGPFNPAYGAADTIVDGVIQEFDGNGDFVWGWAMSDHFTYDEVTFPQRFNNYTQPAGPVPPPGEADVFHINSAQRVADGTGDYVVSARHIDAVFRVDRASGNVEWVLGGESRDTDNNDDVRLAVVGDALGGPLRMHDAQLVGDILTMHDNRTGTSNPSRIVAYQIDPAAGPTGTATLLWQIDHPAGLTSGSLGSARVAPDGAILVGWGATQPMFVEYNSARVEMQRFEAPGESAFRVLEYDPAAFDVDVLRANAGGALDVPT
jgi:hypothetical protein